MSTVPKQGIRTLILGIDNSGCSTIPYYIQGKPREELKLFKPNRGVSRYFIEIENVKNEIWDFAGQNAYRERYLSNAKLYFSLADYVIFVIDIQDSRRYEESLEYLERIDGALAEIGEVSEITIFIHKADPDFRKKADFLDLVNSLKEKIKNCELQLSYQIFLTSLYQPKEEVFDIGAFINNLNKENINFRDLVDVFVYKKLEK